MSKVVEFEAPKREEPKGDKYYVYMLARSEVKFAEDGTFEPTIYMGGRPLPFGGTAVFEAYPAFRTVSDAKLFAKQVGDTEWDILRVEVAL